LNELTLSLLQLLSERIVLTMSMVFVFLKKITFLLHGMVAAGGSSHQRFSKNN
jgi:hypothetical protein